MPISDDIYRDLLSAYRLLPPAWAAPQGGQELLLFEILAAMKGHQITAVWLPFSVGPLEYFLRREGMRVITGLWSASYADSCALYGEGPEAVYFGTPTIVDGKKLFPVSAPGHWNAAKERDVVRDICHTVDAGSSFRYLLCGWGSGDVSLADRNADLLQNLDPERWSTPRIICRKEFSTFTDVLIETEIQK